MAYILLTEEGNVSSNHILKADVILLLFNIFTLKCKRTGDVRESGKKENKLCEYLLVVFDHLYLLHSYSSRPIQVI